MARIYSSHSIANDLGLLLFRIFLGATMIASHGWGKLTGFGERSETFADVMGMGPALSLSLAVMAEVFCSFFLMIGLFTRLALIPLAVTMAVAFFIVHAGDPFGQRELAFVYLASFVTLFFTGPGKFSLDRYILKR